MATKSVISRLGGRVDQLITDHQRLSALCHSLRSERDSLLQERRQLQERVKELEHQLSITQLCEGLGGSAISTPNQAESKAKARARVNRLMREVDKCINLLSATPNRAEHNEEEKQEEVAQQQVTQQEATEEQQQ